MKLIKVISTEVKNAVRVIKSLGLGLRDVQTSDQVTAYGIDSNPIKDMVAVYSQTEERGETVVIGYINKNQLAQPGEFRIFSTDGNGAVQFSIWLRNNGTAEIGGTADNLIRFSPTKDVIEEIQDDIKTLKDAFTAWTPVANDGGAALKAASATWAGTPLQKDIDAAKIDEIKTL